MLRKFRINSKTLSTLIIIAVILIIFFVSGGGIRPIIQTFRNTVTFARTCRGMPDANEIELQIIDVGQGDCALIRSHYGNILIDAGTNMSEADLREHLDLCKVKKIDYFFCSHAHDDHIGGADMVVSRYDVENLILPKSDYNSLPLDSMLEKATRKNLYPTYAKAGDVYTLGDITVTVLSDGSESETENDTSLVLMLSFGEMDFLFTGDISEDIEQKLLDTYSSDTLDCEFLKVAHHGANTSSSTEFLTVASPALASVSCEKNNSYGHPRGEMLRRLSLCGCEILLRTDTMGTCILRTDGNTVYFMASKEFVPEFSAEK